MTKKINTETTTDPRMKKLEDQTNAGFFVDKEAPVPGSRITRETLRKWQEKKLSETQPQK